MYIIAIFEATSARNNPYSYVQKKFFGFSAFTHEEEKSILFSFFSSDPRCVRVLTAFLTSH